MQKILHPNKTRREKEERRSMEGSHGSQDSQSRNVSGVETTSSTRETTNPSTQDTTTPATSVSKTGDEEIQPAKSSSGQPYMQQLAPGEQAPEGYITITHEGASPDAPHMVVREQ